VPVTTIRQLEQNSYPGRGLVVARTPSDGLSVVYFMTGRSVASRDRVLVREGDSVYARSRSASEHDPLRHYRAIAVGPQWCVIGNGDQVDTVAARLESMGAPEAVQGIEYEPDPPLRTPRITVIASRQAGTPLYVSAARASLLDPATTHLTCLTINGLPEGCGVLTTTYHATGSEIDTSRPSTEFTTAAGSASELLAEVWDSLAADRRVAALAVQPTSRNPLVLPARLA
jgi:IMP cyclohydrolase